MRYSNGFTIGWNDDVGEPLKSLDQARQEMLAAGRIE
jgi:hypothetical protein